VAKWWQQGLAALQQRAAAELRTNSVLAPIRAINYTPDGTTKLRISRESGFDPKPTTDTVTVHTHAEFYRDTEGKRAVCLARIVQLAKDAINPVRPPSATPQGKVPNVYLATDRKDGSPTYGAVFLVTDDHKSHWIHSGAVVSEIVNRYQCGALSLGHDNGTHSDWWISWKNTANQDVAGIVLTGWSADVDGPIVDPENPEKVLVELTPEQVTDLANQILAQIKPGATKQDVADLLNSTKLLTLTTHEG